MPRSDWPGYVGLACLLLAAAAGATETAVVTRAEGRLAKIASSYSSPIPDCWIEWRHDASEGTSFHAVLNDVFPNPICDGEFLVHCGGDTLAYAGWWPESDVPPQFFRGASLQVSLRIELLVTDPTAFTAVQHSVGDLAISRHEVTVSTLGGEPIRLAESKASLVLVPGAYEVLIVVELFTGPRRFPDYDGAVTVVWDDAPTPVEATTWGAVKALYRETSR